MESQYRNLPQENRQNLINLIDHIKSETKLLSASLTPQEKTRKTFKDKILFSLLYGTEEIKLHLNEESYWENIKPEKKNEMKELMSNTQERKFAIPVTVQARILNPEKKSAHTVRDVVLWSTVSGI